MPFLRSHQTARAVRDRRPGFTLIEVLMVVVLIGIVVGFAVSRVDFRAFRMDANIRFLQNAIIGARQTAITKNVTVQVMFDATEHRVRILQDFDGNGQMDASDSVRYRPLFEGAAFQSPPTTIDGAAAAYMTGPGVIQPGNALQLAIRIAPNGSVSGDAVIYVGAADLAPNNLRAMTIIGATGRTGFWSRAAGRWLQRNN